MRDYVSVLRQVFRTAGSYAADSTAVEPTEPYAEPVRARLGNTVDCQVLRSAFRTLAKGRIRYGPQVQLGRHADPVEDMDVWETIARAAHRL